MHLTLLRRIPVTLVAALILLSFARDANARPRTPDDDALVAKLLGHADKISAILEKDMEAPKAALTKLDRYLKKHRKPMKALVGKIVAAIGELDEDARKGLARELMFDERVARFLAALGSFDDKHGEDPVYAKKIEARMKELETEGQKLIDALMK